MAYNPGLFGMHNGSLRDCAAAKAEHELVTRVAAKLSKAELVALLASLSPWQGVGGHHPEFYEYNHTAKSLRALAVTYHMHAFNLASDNYV